MRRRKIRIWRRRKRRKKRRRGRSRAEPLTMMITR
jgi:hypothetical protein